MRTTLLLSVAAALALPACGPERDDTAPAGGASDTLSMDQATVSADAPVTAGDAAPAAEAQSFADTLAAGDTFELESSKLAATMAKSAAVKDFAAMMIKDHTASSAELEAAAARLSPAVTPSARLTTAQEADLAALRAAGADFEKLYVEKQVTAHERALELLRSYAATGDAGPLKDFAARTAPVVERHLETVRRLKP